MAQQCRSKALQPLLFYLFYSLSFDGQLNVIVQNVSVLVLTEKRSYLLPSGYIFTGGRSKET